MLVFLFVCFFQEVGAENKFLTQNIISASEFEWNRSERVMSNSLNFFLNTLSVSLFPCSDSLLNYFFPLNTGKKCMVRLTKSLEPLLPINERRSYDGSNDFQDFQES